MSKTAELTYARTVASETIALVERIDHILDQLYTGCCEVEAVEGDNLEGLMSELWLCHAQLTQVKGNIDAMRQVL